MSHFWVWCMRTRVGEWGYCVDIPSVSPRMPGSVLHGATATHLFLVSSKCCRVEKWMIMSRVFRNHHKDNSTISPLRYFTSAYLQHKIVQQILEGKPLHSFLCWINEGRPLWMMNVFFENEAYKLVPVDRLLFFFFLGNTELISGSCSVTR